MAEDIRTLLAKIWQILGQIGLNDTREYITYIAALLTTKRFPFSNELRPQIPNTTIVADETDLVQLQEYLDQINAIVAMEYPEAFSRAQLLDRYVLFYASAFAQKDAYPIPRHIVDFMLAILDIQTEHSLADFTCGAGGFLVNADKGTREWPKRMVGVEISPDWARIAAANAALHNLGPSQVEIIIDDAFHTCGTSGNLQEELFDRIAMAPSFGRSIEKSFTQDTLGMSNVRSSEVLFTYLALKKLEPGGKAIVMVPISLLTNKTGAALRQKLINERLLEAVITLKAGMLQPFNKERVALLLIRKPALIHLPLEQFWLLSQDYDGYPLNPGRDLLAPPPLEENDLPLTKMVLLPEHDFHPIMNGYESHVGTILQTILELQRSVNSPVVIIRVPEDTILADLRHFAVQNDSQLEHYLIVQMLKDDEIYRLAIPLQARAGSLQSVDSVDDMGIWRRNLYQLAEEDYIEEDLPSGDHLFGRATAGQMFAITREGHLLGFSVPFTTLPDDTYSLIANSYLPTIQEEMATPSTEKSEKLTTIAEAADEVAQLLQTLRWDLQQIGQQIINLQERLKNPDVSEKPLPLIEYTVEQDMMMNYLGTTQQLYWQEIRKLIEVVNHDKSTYAIPFTAEELKLPDLMSQAEIHQMLQLLESLGLLIQVSRSLEQEKEQSRMAYRRITNRDTHSPKEHPWSR